MVALKCSEKILLTPPITHYISFILSSFESTYSLLAWQIQKGTEKELLSFCQKVRSVPRSFQKELVPVTEFPKKELVPGTSVT